MLEINPQVQPYLQNRIGNLGVFTPKIGHGEIGGNLSPSKGLASITKYLEQLSIPAADKHRNDIEYLDSLLRDLAEIGRLMAQNPNLFRHAHFALMEEAFNVWNRLRGSNLSRSCQGSPISDDIANKIKKMGTPPTSSQGSPGLRSSLSQESPLRFPFICPLSPIIEVPKAKVVRTHLMPDGRVQHDFRMEKKIYIPMITGYNFIGRIVGPRGISVRQMESATKCDIVIRGKGSIKDSDKENKLMNRRGYEHLKEPLHVYISCECEDMSECQNRLEKATTMIQSLLTPEYDEYKRTQLLQLAIINGTYRPLKNRSPTKSMPKVIRRSKPRQEE